MKNKKRGPVRCDYPGCEKQDAKSVAIKTSWFRGDDIYLKACTEHRKKEHHKTLLGTDKGKERLTA